MLTIASIAKVLVWAIPIFNHCCCCNGYVSFLQQQRNLPLLLRRSTETIYIARTRRIGLSSSSNDENFNSADNERSYYVTQRDEIIKTLKRIDNAESNLNSGNNDSGGDNDRYYADVVAIQGNNNNNNDENEDSEEESGVSASKSVSTLEEISKEINDIETSLNELDKKYLIAPKGLTLDEYILAIKYYRNLPFIVQETICEAIGYKVKPKTTDNKNGDGIFFLGDVDENAKIQFVSSSTTTPVSNDNNFDLFYIRPDETYFNAPDIITELYDKQYQLTQTKLQDLLQRSKERQNNREQNFFIQSIMKAVSPPPPSELQQQSPNSIEDKVFSDVDASKDNALDMMKKIYSNVWNMDDDEFDQIDFDKLNEKTKAKVKDSINNGSSTSSRGNDIDGSIISNPSSSRSNTQIRNILPRIITNKYNKEDTFFNKISDEVKADIDMKEAQLKKDVDILVNDILLNDTTMTKQFVLASRNQPYNTIPGGYVIRGNVVNKTISSQEFIDMVNTKLAMATGSVTNAGAADGSTATESNTQVCFIKLNNLFIRSLSEGDDAFSAEAGLSDDIDDENVLLVTSNDFKPRVSPIFGIGGISTILSFISILIYGISCFSSNDLIMQQIQDLNNIAGTTLGGSSPAAIGGVDGENSAMMFAGLDWFNGQLFDLVLPIVIIQTIHTFAHYVISFKDKIEVEFPSVLVPYWGLSGLGFEIEKLLLPYTSSRTNLLSSPKNLNSLYDFALAGPLAGIIVSFIFLLVGLQTTVSSGQDIVQYYPNLSVDTIRTSTLIGTLVDTFYGQPGVITQSQDLSRTGISNGIPVHPYVIAGYVGLMINSLEMLPLGSTDGGRLSQCVFGRNGHIYVGALAWTVLFVKAFLPSFSDDPAAYVGTDILLTAWLVNNVIQNDMEIPCKNEVDEISTSKAILAFTIWFVSILILTPI